MELPGESLHTRCLLVRDRLQRRTPVALVPGLHPVLQLSKEAPVHIRNGCTCVRPRGRESCGCTHQALQVRLTMRSRALAGLSTSSDPADGSAHTHRKRDSGHVVLAECERNGAPSTTSVHDRICICGLLRRFADEGAEGGVDWVTVVTFPTLSGRRGRPESRAASIGAAARSHRLANPGRLNNGSS